MLIIMRNGKELIKMNRWFTDERIICKNEDGEPNKHRVHIKEMKVYETRYTNINNYHIGICRTKFLIFECPLQSPLYNFQILIRIFSLTMSF